MESFGSYIRLYRDAKRLPLRKVAAYLDIDTSTLSKIERNERSALPEYLKPLSEILQINLKDIQARFIADKINKDFGEMEYLPEGLKMAEKYIKIPAKEMK
ncbi:Helix-turn-helix [Filimonas lacunae]|uniref:Helix-turn-helix n=1 Tax=Filimonas lacunae TaxID=477680 RepID=A0A1N7R6B4_9BACT|nr:helix-turn-helix transcriptional regulator [Filimonas lacunae]SIT30569.1 Helix-turn-helix [Filimonas lacunae]